MADHGQLIRGLSDPETRAKSIAARQAPEGRKNMARYRTVLTASVLVRMLLKEARRQGVTDVELGQRLKVSKAAISRWRRGHTTPDLLNLEAAFQVLGLTLTFKRGRVPDAPVR